jgi:formate hydrogenlyase subunit 3/multisubunit Na+/H+ antiporter MnhD subunit
MCLASYVLVSYGRNEEEASEASVKYLLMSSVGGITILLAISILYGLVGTTNLAYIRTSLADRGTNHLLLLAKGLFVLGYGLQMGISPMHTWLPDAHSAAPSAVSAVLSGAMVETGGYALVRTLLVSSFPLSPAIQSLLLFLALLSAFIGNLSALLQDDLKRLLAFSTVANMGYVLFGIAMGNVEGLTGGVFHILNHAISKGLLFLCAGAFELRTGSRSLNVLSGISSTMPVTYASFFIGAFSLAGFPLFGGFWSEILIIKSAFNVVALPLISLLVLNMVFSMAYCLRMIYILTLKPRTEPSKSAKEAPIPLLLPIAVLASLCVLIGLSPDPFHILAKSAATSAMNLDAYLKAVLGT